MINEDERDKTEIIDRISKERKKTIRKRMTMYKSET